MEIILEPKDVYVANSEKENHEGKQVVKINIDIINKKVIMQKSGRTFKYE